MMMMMMQLNLAFLHLVPGLSAIKTMHILGPTETFYEEFKVLV